MAVKPILTILDHGIELDDMVLMDREDERFVDFKDPSRSSQYPDDKNTGGPYPFVSIRSVVMELDELKDFEIKYETTLPEIYLTISDLRNRLTNIDFPLDGDVISVYIRPNDDDLHKSIRMDFDIMSVTRSGKSPVNYTFYGVCRIPTLFDEITQAKSQMTSFEAMLEICDDLNLGFASNVESTEDRQTWLIAREDRLRWMTNIMDYAYLDDSSFFIGFVDYNYNWNFVNVQECFSEDDQLEEAIHATNVQSDNQRGFDKTSSIGPFLLTNSRSNKGTNMFISYYNPYTEAGFLVRSNGYRRYVQFYDSDEDELIEEFIEPMITRGNESKVLLRGRRDERFFESHVKYKYMGRQSSGEDGNVHPNYLFARILNHQNLEEVMKAGLDIVVDALNTEILRFRRIPVVIYDSFNMETRYTNNERDKDAEDGSVNDQRVWNEQEEVRNEFLSGFYVCYSYSITWRPNERYKTKARLIRREWPARGTTVGSAQQEPS